MHVAESLRVTKSIRYISGRAHLSKLFKNRIFLLFRELLPKLDYENQLQKWERRCARSVDWSESGEFR